ncbi:hypothetical protein AAFF_G00000370 [Aldrovandia affinis]|uniref:Uncharacterized protein n=1 Tax=Aldrovandia affinis TaxID=143900 RepID=A0AAD7TD15_9TELE|nr:hypothetical protein AAFF_G00000370 [Aldrovandia affinis]
MAEIKGTVIHISRPVDPQRDFGIKRYKPLNYTKVHHQHFISGVPCSRAQTRMPKRGDQLAFASMSYLTGRQSVTRTPCCPLPPRTAPVVPPTLFCRWSPVKAATQYQSSVGLFVVAPDFAAARAALS